MSTPSPRKPVLLGMDWPDLALAIVFIGLLAGIGTLLMPTYGWIIAIPIAILLLYIAKRKRDSYYTHDETNSDDHKPG